MGIGINNSSMIGNILNRHKSALESNFQKLASGKQINSAKDNAAGLAIVERFAAQIFGASRAYLNVNDGVSLAQTADGYTAQINEFMQRGRELAVQSANGSLSDSDRAALQAEFSMIQDEVKRITGSAEFNGQKLLNKNQALTFQVDANQGDQVNVKTVDMESQINAAGFFNADISTQNGANAAFAALDDSMQQVNTLRAEFGATLNRFDSIGRNLLNKEENLSASKSRILDTDYAKSISEQTRTQLLNQAATALNGQANFTQGQILNLLGG